MIGGAVKRVEVVKRWEMLEEKYDQRRCMKKGGDKEKGEREAGNVCLMAGIDRETPVSKRVNEVG
jgi:hypothetical protein